MAAAGFLTVLDRAIENIAEAPTRWPEFIDGPRRYLMRRFPFLVVYRVVDPDVQVVAVAHGRRKPDTGASELNERSNKPQPSDLSRQADATT